MTAGPNDVAVDLSNCDREPIHIPGSIQPHGLLLALTGTDLRVAQVSDNVAGHLGRSPDDVLGAPLSDLFDPALAAEVSSALGRPVPSEANPIAVSVAGRRHDAVIHRHQGVAILEVEPRSAETDDTVGFASLLTAIAHLQHAEHLGEIGAMAVQAVRRLTGFQRVMFYRFDEEGHGSVDAESRDEEIDPYLGLHYPASDIPRQARELYLRNWIRCIPDSRYTPSAILPTVNPDTGRPLDLSFSVLRSVSPIHLEYLANMGVRASMSISLVVRGALWGLISCGDHRGPRFVSYGVRAACETIGRLVSLQLTAFEDRRRSASREIRRGMVDELGSAMSGVADEDDVLDALTKRPEALLGLVGATGAATVGRGVRTCGVVPPDPVIADLVAWLDGRPDEGAFVTDTLVASFPAAAAVKDTAAGLLAIALPGRPRRRVLWFRPEQVQTVFWGGDPRKPVEAATNVRLHPRRSFEKWKDEVHLRAERWTAAEVDGADELRRRAMELDLDRQLTRAQRAVRLRDDLVAVVSHDLRNPINVIRMQASALLRPPELGPPTTPDRLMQAAERIRRGADRMSALVSDLLDLAKIESGRFELRRSRQVMRDLIEEALEIERPLAEAKNISLTADRVDAAVSHVDRGRIFQVLANLIGNAIKFTPEGGRITLEARCAGGELQVSTSDTGPGIPEHARAWVFDRYRQEGARTRQPDGAGLGLYIAKGIVEAHGGRIWAEEAEGGGAKLTFVLPCEAS